MEYVIAYLVGINLFGFVLMGVDKRRAVRGRWRIPERSLFLVAIAGGSLGSIAGMTLFRHKTKHPAFRYGLPVLFLTQIALLIGVAFLAPNLL
jgi:uncharacterized membrane protein YsdA (DUF1294 family)